MKNSPRKWLLLRGLSRDQRHWGDFPEQLKECLKDDDIVFVDFPGTGVHNQSQSPASIAAIVDWLRHHYAAQLSEGPFFLIAVSLGGMIAADWMHRFPDEIHGGVIINSSSRLNTFTQRVKPRAFAKLLTAIPQGIVQRESVIVQLICNNTALHEVMIPMWIEFQRTRPTTLGCIARQLIAAARFTPPPITQSLLILASEQDQLVNPLCSQALAKYWQAPLYFHPHAGHDLTSEDGAWVAEQITAWCKTSPKLH